MYQQFHLLIYTIFDNIFLSRGTDGFQTDARILHSKYIQISGKSYFHKGLC